MVKNSYDVALVVGTRPNFIKAAPLVKYFESKNLEVLFIHTGQHFDSNMSKIFFDENKLIEQIEYVISIYPNKKEPRYFVNPIIKNKGSAIFIHIAKKNYVRYCLCSKY